MAPDRLNSINIDDEAEITHTITSSDVDAFVKLTGDDNPIHVDDSFAATTNFKKRVVHGMLTASFISTIIGTKLPGKGALWYEQTTRFLSPVRVGEKIRVWAKVKHKSIAQRIVVLETIVFGEDGREVITGEAKVKIIEQEKNMENQTMLEKKAIIISGSSRGIGSAIAKKLAADGFPVVINYLHGEEQAKKVAKEIEAQGGRAILFKADIVDELEVKKMVEQAITAFGGLTGIVNNASGSIEIKDFLDISWEDMQRNIDVQLKGAFNLSKTALPLLLSQNYGVIVNIASVYADNVPPVKLLPYNTVKSAIVGFSKSLSAEYGPSGIRVNTVSPGMTHTDLISNVPEKTKMTTKMQTPLRRLATVDDIAGAVAFLFSERAAFISGQNLRVCGGIVMQ